MFPALPVLGPLPWPGAGGEASTVLAWQGGSGVSGSGGGGRWRLLRAGAFLPEDLNLEG
jgi:L-threonylcarbamoyladenylate synthase